MPKRPKTHQTAEKAEGIFKRTLPESWIPRGQSPDYGIDYVVEIVEGESLTGLKFAVQLKGKKNLRKAGSNVCFSMETEHLAYYVDKERQPIFLVLIDVSNEIGYWIFLQKYMLYDLNVDDWRLKKTVTIRIPEKNLLSDIDSLHKAIQKAEEFMGGLRPSAIETAVQAEVAHKQSLDTRFAIGLTLEKGGRHYHLTAKETVKFKLSIKAEKTQIKEIVHDFIDRGVPVQLSADQIDVSGSPLIADAMKKGGILHYCRSGSGTVSFTEVDGKQQETNKTVTISGIFEGGTTEIRFSGCLPQSPFSVESTFNPNQDGKGTSYGIRYSFDGTKWRNQHILYLAYFDQVLFLIKHFSKGIPLKADFQIQGNHLFSGVLDAGNPADLYNSIYFLESLSKAREIAKVIQVNPKIPQNIQTDQIQEIENLYRMLIQPEQSVANEAVLCLHMEPQGVKQILAMDKSKLTDGEIAISGSSGEFNFLGITVTIAEINFKMTHAKMLTKLDDLHRKIQQDNSGDIEVKWVGTPKTQVVYDVKGIKVI
jgi:hypothetical protein